ncbi:MAG: Long-chain-fatty-acid--CoA ligase [Alphaproteobacteria bacterium MarineAlpha2_Bin1]|nr:MAG: Long-chain-fatty-acid--CoA ligase [Alphaproteobacteria bacterium MarineAlpha2_Bin1]|tara:strand:+ start:58 stop:1632 length:1575 start_codon:yes stop_codon:yes gene_type:complete
MNNQLTKRPQSYRPITITEGLKTSARCRPDKLALTEEKRKLTHIKLIDRINRVSNLGIGLGLKLGDHVALMCPNCIEFIEITCGLSEIGVAPAMINAKSTPSETTYICNDSKAKVLFVHQDYKDIALSCKFETIEKIIIIKPFDDKSQYETLLNNSSSSTPEILIEEWDVFSIPYTSGTTGKPKGVLLSHRSRVNHMLFTMAANYGCYTPAARPLATSPFHNGAGFINALAGPFFGGTTHILSKYEPELMLRALESNSITSMFMVPTHFHSLFNLNKKIINTYNKKSLKVIHSNAAPLPQATKEKIVDFFGEGILFESYGSTESGGCTFLRPEDQLRKISCVGQPGPGVWLEIRNQENNILGPGEVGEVWVKNSWLFNGYWKKPEETKESLVDGWCTVGDLGKLDNEGYLYLVDRKKNVIISGGQNIFPREIEEVLHRHNAVSEVAVVGKKDDYWGEAVTAFIVLRPDKTTTPEELKDECAKELARYKLPKEFLFVDKIPKNSTGKILHRELRDKLNSYKEFKS